MSKFQQEVEQGGKKGAMTLGQTMKAGLGAAVGFGVGMLMQRGVGMAVGVLSDAAKALMDIERLNAQTDAAIRSTGGVANVTREGVEELSESMESLTTIERETVQEGANLLLTFKRIRNEAGEGNAIFDRATETALDLSVALGTDVRSAAMMLGKALDDPVRGVTALRRAGVALTEQQQEQVKAFVEAGDVLSAQKIILQELESQVQGSAEAFAGTTAGKIQRFQNDVGNMFESIVLGAVTVGDHLGNAADGIGDFFIDAGLTMGDQATKIEEAADSAGVSVEKMRDRIKVAMDEQNLSFEEATEVAANEFAELRAESFYTYAEVSRAAAEGMASAAEKVQAGYDLQARIRQQHFETAWKDARAGAYETMVQYAAGLLDAQNKPKVAMDVLLKVQEEALTKSAEVSRLLGQLNSSELADGLNDGRPEVRAAAQAARQAIENRLRDLGAWNWGYNLGSSYAAGIANSVGVVRTAAGKLAQAATGQIGIRSEPEDADSPLRGITKWGGNIVKTIAEGIDHNLGVGANAAHALAGSLAPSFGTPAFAGAVPTQASAAGRTYIVNVNGVQRTVKSEQEAMQALKDLGTFDEGRL